MYENSRFLKNRFTFCGVNTNFGQQWAPPAYYHLTPIVSKGKHCTTLTPWNFHLKSSSNDWNPRSATFLLYHTRRPGWTISLSLATPPTQPRTQVSERTIIVTTLNHRWPQGQPWSGRVSLKWFICNQCYFHCTEIVKAKFCICHESTGIVSSWHVQKNDHTQTWILRSKAISFCKVSSPRILLVKRWPKCLPWLAWGIGPDHDSTNFVNWA